MGLGSTFWNLLTSEQIIWLGSRPVSERKQTGSQQLIPLEKNCGKTWRYTHASACNWVWSGGAKVLGKLAVRGVLLIWITVGQGPIALTVGAGGVFWTFFLSSIISLFFFPLSGRRPDID